MAPQKSTSRTVYWFCTLVVLIVFVSSYAFMDLATEHLHMYVKVKHEQFNNKPLPLDLTCVPTGQILTAGDDDGYRDMSTSNGSGNTEVDFELSSLTEDEFDEKFTNGERLSPTADSANDAEENGKVSLLDMKTGVDDTSKDVLSMDQNTSHRYDPQAYIDLYKDISEGSLKITDSPPVIFVMAQWRFGSSVFGELFNQNSDLFYLFEPLWTTNLLRKMKGITRNTPESQRMSRNILRKFTKCQFDADFVRILETWNGKTKNKAICKASPKCRVISPNWMSSVCRKYRGRIAAKLIRANLELLKPLVVDDKINLKIIHLVRDPRGSAFSRINYKLRLSGSVTPAMRAQFPKVGRLKPLKLFSVTKENPDTVQGMCKWIRENIIVSPDLLPNWLQGRYYLVRYEDFADTPLKVARELYRFAGIPFHKEVHDWVIQNTHVPVSNKEVFSTHKNSHVAATHWMKDLTEMEVSQVEGECMDVLKLMGYEPYSQLIQQGKPS